MRTMIKTKIGTYTLGAMLIILGLLLDTSGHSTAQAFHHLAMIMGGVTIGIGIRK